MPRHHPYSEVRQAIEAYLVKTGDRFPKSLADVVASGKFHPLHEVGLRDTAVAPSPDKDPIVARLEADEARMREVYLQAMDGAGIDALVLPVATWAVYATYLTLRMQSHG